MRIAIMQPYFLPYIGYFQLINAVDKFIFYDDVNYIKQGWINRNKILLNGEEYLFTLKVKQSSSFKQINKIEVLPENENILKTIVQAYSKAPYFKNVFPLVQELFSKIDDTKNLSVIAEASIKIISEYLNFKIIFTTSSEEYGMTKNLSREERIINICQKNGADTYINSYGGKSLYDFKTFDRNYIKLLFLNSQPIKYPQFNNEFVPWLSILDVLMFNSKEEVLNLLKMYKLE